MEEMSQYSTTRQPEVLSVGNWMLTILIAIIPVVNFIMFFVWAFGDNTNPNKANWAKAQLLWILIAIAFYGLGALILGSMMLVHK